MPSVKLVPVRIGCRCWICRPVNTRDGVEFGNQKHLFEKIVDLIRAIERRREIAIDNTSKREQSEGLAAASVDRLGVSYKRTSACEQGVKLSGKGI